MPTVKIEAHSNSLNSFAAVIFLFAFVCILAMTFTFDTTRAVVVAKPEVVFKAVAVRERKECLEVAVRERKECLEVGKEKWCKQ